jgi:flagellar basal body-associated protein FliL
MAEKAELDILEIELPKEEPPVDTAPVMEETDPGARRKRFLKIAALCFFVLVVCGAVFTWIYVGGDKAGSGKKQPGVAAPGGNFMALDHFAVNIRDAQGNYRILACDVALELNRGADAAKDRMLELRKAVYKTVRGNGSQILQKSPKTRKQLLKDIEKEVNGILGEGAVKQAYFTRYTLL